jgi:hypothetical protein
MEELTFWGMILMDGIKHQIKIKGIEWYLFVLNLVCGIYLYLK